MADAMMTLDEAEAHVRSVFERRDALGHSTGDHELILAIIGEIKRIREFLYERMGELP